MSKISIYDIAKILVEKNGLTKSESEQFVAAIFDVIQEGLDNDNLVKVKGLGTFKIIGVEARESVNVNTGERVVIESHGKVTFTPDAVMKELVNKPFSQFETVILNDGIEFDDIQDDKLLFPVNDEVLGTDVINDTEEDIRAEGKADIPRKEQYVVSGVSSGQDGYYREDKEQHVQENDRDYPNPSESAFDTSGETMTEDESGDVQSEEAATTVTEDNTVTTEETSSETQADIPVTTETTASATEETKDEEPVAEGADIGTRKDNSRIMNNIIFAIVSVVLILLSLYVGYRLGMDTSTHTEVKPKVIIKRVIVRVSDFRQNNKADSISLREDSAAAGSSNDKSMMPTEEKAERAATDREQEVDYKKYAAKDIRVRTGAYNIVGTDRVWTVRKGETLGSITRRTLGDGMSCYIEVYNDLTDKSELEEGQKIKIPKLKLKRKIRK